MSPNERGNLRDIERLIGSKIPQETMAGFESKGEVLEAPVRRRTFRPRRQNGVGRRWY